MENATEPISEEAAAIQQHKLAELRRYNREYYHAHKKKTSDCEHCKKTFSSVSALRRHQVKNLRRKLLQATETIEKFMQSGLNNRYRLLGVIPPLPYHICVFIIRWCCFASAPRTS